MKQSQNILNWVNNYNPQTMNEFFAGQNMQKNTIPPEIINFETTIDKKSE